MYQKWEEKIGIFTSVSIGSKEGSFIRIIPDLGAMVHQIGINGIEILKEDAPDELESNPWFRGRVLFPFNDRIPSGKYNWQGQDFSLPINEPEDGSAIHGLVYDKNFTEKECRLSETSAALTYSYTISSSDEPSYPFDVQFSVTYSIDENGVAVEYSFLNPGSVTAPVALGWHPYFSLSGRADSWNLQAGGGRYVAVDQSLNPTGEIPAVEGGEYDFTQADVVGKGDLDLAFTASKEGYTYLDDGKNRLSLYFDPKLFPYVQLFIPPDRESIAIEPISAATNSFNIEDLGRIDLKPGEERKGIVEIRLNRV